jgi:arginine-tRNA-protein transferase
MDVALHFLTPAGPCGYLPEETWQLEYQVIPGLTAEQYEQRMAAGWRHFGWSVFRPQCPACQKCQPIRVVVNAFRPNRSQRRVRRLNEGVMRLEIDRPRVTRRKLALYDKFHAFQSEAKGWPVHKPRDPEAYRQSFVDSPFPIQEWCYYLDGELIGVGYVDALPASWSAIYFFYDPECRDRSLGIWNVLCIIEHARQQGIPHVYLGYYVAGCGSMEYKAGFVPNEVRDPDGTWRRFRV